MNTIGWVFAELEDHEQALEWNRLGLELIGSVPSMPDSEIEMHTRLNLGDNLAALGRGDEAEERFKRVEQVVRNPTPAQRWLLWRWSLHFFHSYGELLLGRGEASRALAYIDEGLALAEETWSRKYIVKGRRLRGQALAAEGRFDNAEQELSAALGIAIELANPPQLWKTRAALGELRRAQGKPKEAQRTCAEALLVVDEVAARLNDEKLRDTFRHSGQVEAIRPAAGTHA